jgi:hypothetical protein
MKCRRSLHRPGTVRSNVICSSVITVWATAGVERPDFLRQRRSPRRGPRKGDGPFCPRRMYVVTRENLRRLAWSLSMTPTVPIRVVAGALASVVILSAFPSGADADVHAPHVPEIHYAIPSSTSATISASGTSSRAPRRGVNSGPVNGSAINN